MPGNATGVSVGGGKGVEVGTSGVGGCVAVGQGVIVGRGVGVLGGPIVGFGVLNGGGSVGIGMLVGVQVAVGFGIGVPADELPPQPARVMITRNNRSSKSRRFLR